MNKHAFCIIVSFVVCFITLTVYSEGLLPSLTDVYGVPMPSLGEALNRYADSEEKQEDGSIIQKWNGISEDDFDAFSTFLTGTRAELRDYSVENNVFSAMIGKNGKEFYFSYDLQAKNAVVIYPKGTYNEQDFRASSQYGLAKRLMGEKKYEDAYVLFTTIAGYKDVDNLMNTDQHLVAEAERIATITAEREAKFATFKTVGGYALFGTYPQTSEGTDNSPIEWLVLDYDADNNKTLLLSRYGLDVVPFETENEAAVWRACSLRTWLNNDFLSKAFSDDEQSAILITEVDNSKSQGYQGYDGWYIVDDEITQDRIFQLSYMEANKYLNVTDENNTMAKAAPTAYCEAMGANVQHSDYAKTADGKYAGYWWLRSQGWDWAKAACVDFDGGIGSATAKADNGMIRPAFWLDLNAVAF